MSESTSSKGEGGWCNNSDRVLEYRLAAGTICKFSKPIASSNPSDGKYISFWRFLELSKGLLTGTGTCLWIHLQDQGLWYYLQHRKTIYGACSFPRCRVPSSLAEISRSCGYSVCFKIKPMVFYLERNDPFMSFLFVQWNIFDIYRNPVSNTQVRVV